MIDSHKIFTFTLLYKSDNDKLILVSSGETPAKSEEEADSVLSSSNPDEKEAVEKVISKMFPNAEVGSEESVSGTLQELEDKYDVSLEELEEEVGEDLDNDQEKGEGEEHAEKVLGHKEGSETEEHEEGELSSHPIVAVISLDSLTDPTSIMNRMPSNFTLPLDFESDELVEEDIDYNPILAIADSSSDIEDEELEEQAGPQELVRRFINTAAATKKGVFGIQDVTQIFNQLHVTDPDAKLQALQLALRSGNVKLFQLPGRKSIQGRMEVSGDPILVVGSATQLPPGAVEIPQSDSPSINQAISKFVGTL